MKKTCQNCGFGMNPGGRPSSKKQWYCIHILVDGHRRLCPAKNGCEKWISHAEARKKYPTRTVDLGDMVMPP